LINVIKLFQLIYKLGAFHFQIYWTIKSTLGFGSLYCYRININVCVGVMDLGMIYLRLQTCWNGFISILNMLVYIATNMNIYSMLLEWDLWNHMVNNSRFFLYTMFFWHLISTQCTISMFGAFTNSILTCCTCCPSYTYTILVISWCMTCFNYFLIFFITIIYSWHFMKLLGFTTSIALILRQTWIDSTQK
jgi:hypothetical protein